MNDDIIPEIEDYISELSNEQQSIILTYFKHARNLRFVYLIFGIIIGIIIGVSL